MSVPPRQGQGLLKAKAMLPSWLNMAPGTHWRWEREGGLSIVSFMLPISPSSPSTAGHIPLWFARQPH